MNDINKPKNRKTSSLPICVIEIESKEGIITTDPNGVVVMAATGNYSIQEPVDDIVSELSGKPAYLIRFDDIELALSFDELDRFLRHDLKTDEYEKLLNKYGMFHEIHSDFYWNGVAEQPIEIADKTEERIKVEEQKNELNKVVIQSKKNIKKKI